jgi:nitroreductase
MILYYGRLSLNTLEAISKRRSIRNFLDTEIPKEIVEKILRAAILAPSAGNLQPWKFIVVTNSDKAAMIQAMKAGIERTREDMRGLPNLNRFLASAINSTKAMEQAPITVFVFNTVDDYSLGESDVETSMSQWANTQSIGAAIENMLLAATSLGIGSLWICDVFFASQEIGEWLG